MTTTRAARAAAARVAAAASALPAAARSASGPSMARSVAAAGFAGSATHSKPAGAASSFFSVAPSGSARRLAVGYTHVAFEAGEAGSLAGIVVALGGLRVKSDVGVVAG